MTQSNLTTESHNTTQQSSRNGRAIDHIVLHHTASTGMDQTIDMMVSGSRQVSANYVVKDRRIARIVPEEYRSWSLSSAEWDGRSITFEIANSSNGGGWPVSPESQESVARVVADISSRYGIPLNRDRILGHREVYTRHGASYPTACPGGLDMDWIVARAKQIKDGDDMSAKAESQINSLFNAFWNIDPDDFSKRESGLGKVIADSRFQEVRLSEADRKAIVEQIVVRLPAGNLSPEDVAQAIEMATPEIARAVNDETARRLAG